MKALTECSVLQQKLTETQNKLNPFKSMRKDFKVRVEAKHQLAEITEGLDTLELEVEKANMVLSISDKGLMSEEEQQAAQEMVAPLNKDVMDFLRVIEAKTRTAQGPMREELNLVKERAFSSRRRLEAIGAMLKTQKDRKISEDILATAA